MRFQPALEGQPLAAGHPFREAYLGRPDPVANGSQNPVGYCELPEEQSYLMRPCACGCGDDTDRDFLPGHDVRAIQARVREVFGGSALALIQFLDAHRDPAIGSVVRGLAEEVPHPDGVRGATPHVHIDGAPVSPVNGGVTYRADS